MSPQNRQLVAILFTDIVGYTAMMQQNEQNAIVVMKQYTRILEKTVSDHQGQILNDYGDGSLCSFSSVTQAMLCAVEMQRHFQTDLPVPLRIGVHAGEIFFEGKKVMGDGVNVASRIQSLGQANTVLFSKEVYDKIKNQPEFKTVSLGLFHFKSVDEPMEVFALANTGLVVPKKEEMSGKLKEIQNKSKRIKWLVTFAILVLLTVIFFLNRSFRHASGFTGTEKSVAVLPFENIGTDKTEDYLSDGITQDIINNLSKITSLQKVIGWISVRGFKKTTKTITEIADELDVAAILSGTIDKQGARTRIRAELTEVSTNKILWGDEFEFSGDDILSVQSKMALQVVNALKANLTSEEKKGLTKNYTDNPEAYRLYRKGRFFWDQRTKASYDSAESYYKRAIELDPDYALAYVGLADCYTFNQKGLPQTTAIPIAKTYAEKALSIDSTLTEAMTTLAFIQANYEYDIRGSIPVFKKIIRENPNYSLGHRYLGNIYTIMGDWQAGIAETKKGLALDPLSLVDNMVLGRNYFFARQYDSAYTQLEKAITMNPKFPSSYLVLGNVYLATGSYKKAIDAYSKLPPGTFDQGTNGLLLLSTAYQFAGDTLKAKELFAKVSNDDLLKCSHWMAYAYISQRNYQRALDALECGYAIHSLAMLALKTDPNLDPLRKEPRFIALLKKINFD
jgi:adenylate cyclase